MFGAFGSMIEAESFFFREGAGTYVNVVTLISSKFLNIAY